LGVKVTRSKYKLLAKTNYTLETFLSVKSFIRKNDARWNLEKAARQIRFLVSSHNVAPQTLFAKRNFAVRGLLFLWVHFCVHFFLGLYRDVQSVCLSVAWRAEDKKLQAVDGKVCICPSSYFGK